ncbi:MAG: BatA domain-containing protein [Lentimicrobium sp.]|nr:BatA domain-containing protein [Lentimicrobium sp.]
MQFVNPYFLYGLLAISIPIAIHLFNFRRYRKLHFSNVDLLRNYQKRTRKQSELLHYLVLAARVLTISALVFAFAQPYIPKNETLVTGSINLAGIFVDNSYSMDVGSGDGRKLDEAKHKAAEIAMAYDADDLFQLLTNDFEGRHQRLVSRDEFLLMLRDVNSSPLARSFSEIHDRQAVMLENEAYPSASSFMISDFQNSTVLSYLPDSSLTFSTFLVGVDGNNSANLFIDSCWFENPALRVNQVTQLYVKITNVSDNNLEKIPVRLTINREQRAVASVDFPANNSIIITMSFSATKTGVQKAVVDVSDYPVVFDDSYFMVFNVSEQIPVLSINHDEPNTYVNNVFSLDSILKLTNISQRQINLLTLKENNLIVLNGLVSLASGTISELSRFVEEGGSIAVFPSPDNDNKSINQLLSAMEAPVFGSLDTSSVRVSAINKKHSVLANVFDKSNASQENTNLPYASKHYSISKPLRGVSDNLMTLDNGDPFITMKSFGRGKVFLIAVTLSDDWGNFHRHALFVPVMLNIAFQSENQEPLCYFAGGNAQIVLEKYIVSGDNVLRITSEDGSGEFIPEVRKVNGKSVVYVHDHITQAGFYNVVGDGKPISVLAFNYNRKESDLRCAGLEELKQVAMKVPGTEVLSEGKKEVSKIIAERNHGHKLWKWFVAAALLFILSEVLLLRFFRRSKSEVKL